MSAEDIQFNLDNPPVGSVDFSFSDFDLFNDPVGSGMFDASGNLSMLGAETLLADPQLFEQFKAFDPEAAALLEDPEIKKLLRQQSLAQSGQNAVANIGPQGDTGVPTQSAGPTGLAALKKQIADALGVKEDTLGDMAKYAAMLGVAKLAKDDAERARKEARGAAFKSSAPATATRTAYKGTQYAAAGGLASLAGGGKTDLPPRYLNGHTDGMADNVPAHIDRKRPAALSDGEFVIPADVVSHLGNGNSNAGAKRLYEMMDRIRSARTGNSKQGKQINPNRFLPR
jgi:hypothetical protein